MLMPQSLSDERAMANDPLTVPASATVDQTRGVIPSSMHNHLKNGQNPCPRGVRRLECGCFNRSTT